jgi:osmotically-inducible protein OsmY
MMAPALALTRRPGRARPDRAPALGLFLLLPILVPILAGCSPIGAAETAGVFVAVQATQERGLDTALSDDLIWTKVQARWLDNDADMFSKVRLQIHEGRLLLTGVVQTATVRMTAVRLAWEVDGVKEVINEIKVAEAPDLGQAAQDQWVAQELRNKMLFDSAVRSVNYSVEAVEGTIYLMGIAQNKTELQRVIDHARDISYVRKVVSYVRIKGEPPPPVPAQTEPALGQPVQSEPAPTIDPAPIKPAAPS